MTELDLFRVEGVRRSIVRRIKRSGTGYLWRKVLRQGFAAYSDAEFDTAVAQLIEEGRITETFGRQGGARLFYVETKEETNVGS